MFKMDDGKVFLECDECMSGFMAVIEGRVAEEFWAGDVDWEVRHADAVEIAAAGLAEYVADAT